MYDRAVMAWSTRLRCALLFALALTLTACGARSALYEPRDGAVIDVPIIDVPIIDVPVIDVPVIDVRDVPAVDVRDVPVVDVRDVPPVDVPVTVTAVCPASQRVVETQTATLAGAGRHSLGLPLTYAWAVEAAPPGVTVAPGTLLSPTSPTAALRAIAPGTWRLRLTVSDTAGRSNSCVTAVDQKRPRMTLSPFW